ncbi:TadE/TadG family type IV pilus assembly protein [Vibrio astriarenae]
MLMKLARYSLRKTKGIGTIEFVMGFMLFWWMCMAWVEASFMSYVSALGDLAVSEAARATKVESYSCKEGDDLDSSGKCETSKEFYNTIFNNVIKNSSSLWAGVVSSSSFKWDVDYLASIEDLKTYDSTKCGWIESIEEDCIGIKSPSSKAIAIYRINYEYQPMFNYFLDSNEIFLREVIVIQEYERDQFYFN